MKFWEAVRMAAGSLRANKLRSALTLIGVIIGIISVVTIMSVIAGLNLYVATQLANLGSKPSLCQLRFHEPRRPEIRVGSYKDAGAG